MAPSTLPSWQRGDYNEFQPPRHWSRKHGAALLPALCCCRWAAAARQARAPAWPHKWEAALTEGAVSTSCAAPAGPWSEPARSHRRLQRQRRTPPAALWRAQVC